MTTPEERADRDAYLATLPPPEPSSPASVGQLLAQVAGALVSAEPPDPELPPPDPVSALLAALTARPVDATTGLAVALIDPADLSGSAARDYLVLTDKLLAAATAAQHVAVLAVADTARAEVEAALDAHQAAAAGTRWQVADTERIVREDLERTLGCTRNDAEARLAMAEDLRDRVPRTGALLAAGMLSARKAAQLVHLLANTTPEVAGQVDAGLADQLTGSRPASLRRRIARRLLVLDRDHAERQDREVVRARTVRTWSNPDGSATLSLTGPPEAIQHAWKATTGAALAEVRDARNAGVLPQADIPAHRGTHLVLEPVGTTAPPAGVRPATDNLRSSDLDQFDHRGQDNSTGPDVRPATDSESLSERDGSGRMDRARFDAAIDLLCSAYDAPWFPASQGKRRTLVQLVTTVATLTGADDNLAELVGHGPVTAQTARRIAADADMFQHLQVHPSMGFLMDAGKIRHDPPAELREFLLARRPTCAMTGCTRSVMQAADLDHTIEHHPDGSGGPTAAWAMHGLCRFHHRARTLGLWRLTEQRLDGSLVWTDPAGRRYVEPPHDLRPDAAA